MTEDKLVIDKTELEKYVNSREISREKFTQRFTVLMVLVNVLIMAVIMYVLYKTEFKLDGPIMLILGGLVQHCIKDLGSFVNYWIGSSPTGK